MFLYVQVHLTSVHPIPLSPSDEEQGPRPQQTLKQDPPMEPGDVVVSSHEKEIKKSTGSIFNALIP